MSTPAHDLRTALLLGLGLALTGCLDKEEDDDAGDDTSTSPSDDTSSPTQTLDPLPDGDYPSARAATPAWPARAASTSTACSPAPTAPAARRAT